MTEETIQIQEAEGVPIKRNPKRPIARHLIIKVSKFKDKERILKSAREETGNNIQGSPNKASS